MLRWSKKDCSSLCPPERKTATIVEYSFSSWRDSVFLQEFTKWSYSLASSLVAVQLKKRARKSEMQLLRRCLSIVLIYTTLVAIQQLALAQEPNEVERLREEQTKVGCMLKYNETLRAEFYYNIGNSQDTRISRFAEGYDDNVRCWAIRYCPDAPVSWCVHLYHPEKSIELCYNNTGHVTRTTEAAAALMLQEKFQMQPELCHTRWPSCIRTISPDAFLSYSYLSCTAESDTCYKQTFSAFEVVGSGDTINPPEFAFSSSSSDMFLKETNILRCDISVPARLYVLGLQSGWKINGVRFKTDIPQHPNCGIDPSLSLDSDECSSAFDNTEELRQKRVRQYRLNHLIKTCPFATVLIHIWLVVENASLEDVAATYACYGEYVIHNPVQTPLVAEEILHVNPVYPLLNVTFMETPHIQSNLSYHPEPSETLQWNCSVQAGLGDRLVWMLNKKELLHIDIDNLIPTENLNCSSVASYNSDSIVVSEIKELGQFERQFTSTLLICQITELTAGFYECVVNRTWRGDDRSVRVWSAMLVSSTSTTTLPESANVHTITGHLMIIISVSVVTSFIVVVFVLVTIITLCVRHGQSRKPSRAVWELAMGNISVTDDILTEFRRKNSLKKEFVGPSLEHQDPMEFPRNRLILLDRVLGEGTFGLVRQARAEGIVESTPERNIVAVKTTRAKAPPQEMNNFWEELQLMKNMVPHGNIVNLLGHCTTPGGPIYMIIEYANHGSLKDFLKMCEEAVLKLNHIPQIQQSFRSRRTSSANTGSSSYPHLVFKLPLSAQNSVFSTTSTPTALIPPTPDSNKFDFSSAHHQNIRLATEDSGFFGENGDQAAISDALGGALTAHSVVPLTHNYVNSKGLLYMEDVQNFALQIACGLKHLEDIQIVHCDLAARNILIAEGFVLKIGDFGMARDVSEKEYYRKQGGRVPVKWTAPEALMDHIFTFKSDIWSFGVILWEIFTYGQQPYHKFKIRHLWEPFINHLMEGKRLEQPKGCPDAFYTLMQSCWHSSPNQRPTADDLVQILSQTNLLDEEDGLTGSDSGTQLSIESCADIDACVHIPQETQI